MSWYRWWKKSQTTTWDVRNPIDGGINYQPQLVSRISAINSTSCTLVHVNWVAMPFCGFFVAAPEVAHGQFRFFLLGGTSGIRVKFDRFFLMFLWMWSWRMEFSENWDQETDAANWRRCFFLCNWINWSDSLPKAATICNTGVSIALRWVITCTVVTTI